MPPSLPQLHFSGHQMESSITTSPTIISSISPRIVCGQSRLADADTVEHAYQIPTLHKSSNIQPSSEKRQKPDRFKLRHGRSVSNPFPLLFHGKEKRQGGGGPGPLEDIEEKRLSQTIQSLSPPALAKSLRVPDRDLTTGSCMTCGSIVRWPKELLVYRCTVCLTINDLKVLSADIVLEPGRDSSLSKSPSSVGKSTLTKVEPLSTVKTRELIVRCIRNHLVKRLAHNRARSGTEKSTTSSLNLQSSTGPVTQIDQRHNSGHERLQMEFQKLPTHFLPLPKHRTEQGLKIIEPNPTTGSHSRVYPTSKPHSSSSHNIGMQVGTSLFDIESQPTRLRTTSTFEQYADTGNKYIPASVDNESNRIFKQLEDYIVACFTSRECINASFSTLSPITATCSASESTKQAREVFVDDRHSQSSMQLSEMDAKTLLLGDFAENGSWWTGDEDLQVLPSRSRKYPRNSPRDILPTGKYINRESPEIDWQKMSEWYDMVLYAGNEWKLHLHDILHSANNEMYECLSMIEIDEIEDQILEAQAHTQRVLLKAIESLLKRPGAPLKEPGDIRFLLIILRNPLLYSSYEPLTQASYSRSVSQAIETNNTISLPQPLHRNTSPGPPRRLHDRDRGTGKHSGIIKRILGLLSNLSNGCHHHLVAWFSRFSDEHFEQIVELVGGFVTYRLMKEQRKQQVLEQDPMSTLVPSLHANGPSGSAALHTVLSLSEQPKKRSAKVLKPVIYSDDWQIKAAARVMALLFAANHVDKISQDKPARHGYILATSTFYNTLLDYCDLIGDFEAWEARRAKFSFCQYPFFLSIWAKIKILEYDARRQMEVKAREAFFDSIMTRKTVNQYLVLRVRRNCLIEDSLKGVSEVVGSGSEEIKKGLRIEFKGEEGIDAGGLRKEWFLLLVRDVFNPDHGMFSYDDESHFCYFNPFTFETSDQFFLVGVVLGLAIYNSTILDVALPPFAFRKLLAAGPTAAPSVPSRAKLTVPYSLEDLAELRPTLANGLRQLLDYDGDVETTFCRDFVADVERYGQIVQVPLCPNGENMPVTNANRGEFVDLYVRYLLETSVNRQFEPFKRGFFTMCGGNALSLFRPEEIELLIRGSDEVLDIPSLQAVAVYENWGTTNPAGTEPVIGWFWRTFERANPNDQRKLLSFITGSDRIPAMGAASLPIKLSCLGGDSPRYPVARTCFNMLSLWRYSSAQKLENVLWRAVHESEGFGLK